MHQSILDIAGLLAQRPIVSVGPQIIWNERLDRQILAIPLDRLYGNDRDKKVYGLALQAAFLIYNDSLSKGHDVLQDPIIYDRNETGDYWHALMHRKEGDYNNAKHWFPSTHPIHTELQAKVRDYLQTQTIQNEELRDSLATLSGQTAWNPSLFVGIVEKYVKQGLSEEAATLLNNIQRIELELLLDFTCKKALDKGFSELVS